MTVTPASFRATFPEFASTTDYPDAQVSFYLGLAAQQLDPVRWDTSLDYGAQLFTAHYLAIGYRDQQAAAVGGAPGVPTGPQASKAVDKVSASYNTQAITYADGGFWNATTYGLRFWQLARLIGAGAVQL